MNKLPKLSRLKIIKEIFNDPDRKPLLKILKEIIYLSFVNKKFPPQYYTARYLFKKEKDNIRDFFPDKFFTKVNRHFNDSNAREVLENKLFFDFYYSQFNIPLPRLLAYNHNKMFVADRKISIINTPRDLKHCLQILADKIPANDSIIIKKTSGSYGGDRVFKIYKDQISEDRNEINDLYREISRSDYLFQEKIKQHPALDSLNSSCVNSIRIDTFIDKDGKAEVISAYLRTSITGLHVDNISSGGCQISIDINTGRLEKLGHMEIIHHGIKQPDKHPITQTVFENFSIPYFDEVKSLVCRVATYMPMLRLVGWDVAIGEKGPILIEGNSCYDISGNDLAYGGYRSNPVFRKALLEMNYL